MKSKTDKTQILKPTGSHTQDQRVALVKATAKAIRQGVPASYDNPKRPNSDWEQASQPGLDKTVTAIRAKEKKSSQKNFMTKPNPKLPPIEDATTLLQKLEKARVSPEGAKGTPRKAKLITKRKKHIELHIYSNSNTYPIELDRMDTPEKILGWIHHLTEKGNVTTAHIRAFIDVAKEMGVKIDFNA